MSNSIQAGAADDDYAIRVEQRVIETIVDRLHVGREQVTRDARLYDLTDSLGLTEIVMDLEDEFEGSMPDEAVGTIQTVGQLVDYVRTNFHAPREKDKAGP
jgi:acyl carrier protein